MMISGLLTGLLAGIGLMFVAWNALDLFDDVAWWKRIAVALLVWALVGYVSYHKWREYQLARAVRQWEDQGGW